MFIGIGLTLYFLYETIPLLGKRKAMIERLNATSEKLAEYQKEKK